MSDVIPDSFFGGYCASVDDIIIGRYRLICTCGACPEQYDVYDDTTQRKVGYLRLRHGSFRADIDDCGGDTVYEAETAGDGIFDDDERMPQLTAAINALDAAIVARSRKDS